MSVLLWELKLRKEIYTGHCNLPIHCNFAQGYCLYFQKTLEISEVYGTRKKKSQERQASVMVHRKWILLATPAQPQINMDLQLTSSVNQAAR